jgi:pyrrolidone-carboxylate peptidase
MIAGVVVASAQLPCRFASAIDALRNAIEACRPSVVLAVGQAGESCAFTLVAIQTSTMPASRNYAMN